MAPCPGACNASWRATGEGDPRPGDPVWCAMDAARIRRQVPELDELAALREYQVTGLREQGRNPAHGTAESPSPSPAADDLDELEDWLTGWEDAYRDEHNKAHPERPWLTRPYRGVLTNVRLGTVAWLTANLDGILACEPIAADFGAEAARWHRELRDKTRAGTGRRRGVIPCPRCEWMLLGSDDDGAHWRCGKPSCGRLLDRDEYQELCDVARRLEHAG
jgi:hypothetical protein